MKPFYGIDNTNDAENEKENGDEFLVQKSDEKLYAEYDKAVNGVFANIRKSFKLPFVLKVIQYLALSVGGFLIVTMFEYFFSEENAEINAIALKIVFVIILCAVIFIVLNFIIKNLKKNEDESEEQHLQSRKANVIY